MVQRKQTRFVQVKVRMPGHLKRRLEQEAKKRDDGSLSAEIVARLERTFTDPPQVQATATATATAVANELLERGWVVDTRGKK
jgi:hypothetical protein